MSKSRMMKKNDSNIVDVSVVITVRMSGNSSENQRFSYLCTTKGRMKGVWNKKRNGIEREEGVWVWGNERRKGGNVWNEGEERGIMIFLMG